MRTTTGVEIEPSAQDIDDVMRELQKSWTATITIRRQSPNDVGYREIFVSLDGELLAILNAGDACTREIAPGRHKIQANNTLFWRTIEFTVGAGEHASFVAINRAGFGTYSVLSFFIGFLGAGPLYLTFERDSASGP